MNGLRRSADNQHNHHNRIENIEPAVYSVSRELKFAGPVETGPVTEAFCGYVEELQEWAAEHGHLVGHIKVYMESGGQYMRISGTGHAVQRQASEEWGQKQVKSIELRVTAILIGPSSDRLEPVAAGILERLIVQLEDKWKY